MDNARLLLQTHMGIDTYLHNNYVEMLVDGGLIGFIIYYSIYIKLIINLIKNKAKGDRFIAISLVMVALMLISEYGSVSYYEKNTYFYFMILYLEIEIVRRVDLSNNQ